LFELTPTDVRNIPYKFTGNRDAKGYSGEFIGLDSIGELKYGSSWLITECEKNNDIESLQNRINNWKQSMDEENRLFYEKIVAIRESIIKAIIENYLKNITSSEKDANQLTKKK
jgi:hypothetical protein